MPLSFFISTSIFHSAPLKTGLIKNQLSILQVGIAKHRDKRRKCDANATQKWRNSFDHSPPQHKPWELETGKKLFQKKQSPNLSRLERKSENSFLGFEKWLLHKLFEWNGKPWAFWEKSLKRANYFLQRFCLGNILDSNLRSSLMVN